MTLPLAEQLRLSDFDFDLPEALIAQEPAPERDRSRLMVLDRRTGGIEQETPGLRRLLYHEYTHAVVLSITPRVPTWLNEGLAQYFEGKELDDRQKDALGKIARAGKLPSLSNLEGSFMGLNNNQATYAYLFSLSSVRYMIDTFGMYRVKSVLDELAAGADVAKAVSNGTTLSYEELDRGWKRSLE